MSDLASIQRIIDLQPIEGADKIERATVLGWFVVVKKGEFKVGDLCCYIQIDTVVPEREEFEFLRVRKFRVKTIKLKGQISQGLIIPTGNWKGRLTEGCDVTGYVGVTKYEKPDNNPARFVKPRVPKVWYKKWIYLFKFNILFKVFPKLQRLERSPFPTNLISITDEERIQNIPKVLKTHEGKVFIVSHKLDGSSITIIHSKVFGKSKFRICSRRFELHDKKNDWYKVFTENNFADEVLKLVRYFNTNDVIVQGECIGKFNGNHHNLQRDQIRLFTIQVDGKRINQRDFLNACLINNIPHCQLHKEIRLNHTMESILKASEIKDCLNPVTHAEGLVYRCVEDNTSFKVINNNYLLLGKD